MNTFVELRKIRFYAYHGVAEQERCVGNDYEIYVKVKYPFKDAMETDNYLSGNEDFFSFVRACCGENHTCDTNRVSSF